MNNKKLYIAGILAAGLISVTLLSSAAFSKANKGAEVKQEVQKQEPQKQAVKEEVTVFDKWNLVCAKPEKEGKKQCRIVQNITDGKASKAAMVFTVSHDKEKKPVTVMRIFTPLGVNLLAKLGFAIDDMKKPMAMPYRFCGAAGCTVLAALKEDFTSKLKDADDLHLTYQAANSAKPVKVDVSMKGFDKAYDALLKAAN